MRCKGVGNNKEPMLSLKQSSETYASFITMISILTQNLIKKEDIRKMTTT
jgi:hypothetical protein